MISFHIDGQQIGLGHPTFVIAEIGVNHDGSVNKALELVRIAANCGASAVKLQLFRATTLLHSSSFLAGYQRDRAGEITPVDLLRKYELPTDDLRRIVKTIRELKMVPLATPFSPPDVEMLETLRIPAIKIASPDLINRVLLQRAISANRPVLLSTGASDMTEIQTTVEWMKDWGASFALLHCISAYPTPAAQLNLCWINELASQFDVPVGFSDHTTETMSGALAAAAGACIVERHLTYDRTARGPDHAASSDPTHFERYVKLIRDADTMRGSPGKQVLEIEQDVRNGSRQSLVVRRSMKPGEILRESDLTVQRPGTGISPAKITELSGRRVMQPIQAGAMLEWEMISNRTQALSDVA